MYLLGILIIGFSYSVQASPNDLLVVAVARNQSDAHHRFIRSLNIYGYKYEVIIKDLGIYRR
jgi:hypothetical protein